MIKRIVKLTLREEAIAEFLTIFEESKTKIKASEGCLHLELLRGAKHTNILFTYSFWENEAALDAYRRSGLFKETWKKTKALFAERAEAWSVEVVSEV
ncbi:MAG TPA: antibiotic biosynthesis monooxygenase [Bacteroidetes bacterium]|nr:antibiotic biosynthesis monooxygenase [Bacteroidota bacterium]